MKKRMFAIFLAVMLLCGCAADPAESRPFTENAITFTDDLDRSVTVENPRRVAALLGSFAQVWVLAGGEICATAEDAWTDLELELGPEAVNLGHTKSLNLEALLAAQPEFILASTNTRQHMEWKDTLEGAGLTVAYFDIADFEDYLRLLELCTRITGRQDLYERHGTHVQVKIDGVLERSRQRLEDSEPPVVLSLVASASSISAKNSRNNVLGEMLHALGCVNIADSEDSLLEKLSLEYILQADPDYIFFVQRGDDTQGTLDNIKEQLESNPLWGQLTAVKEGRVYMMDKNLYNLKPNHRWGEAYEGLEAILANEN